MGTATLKELIDNFSTELLRRAFAGEEEAIESFALKTGGLVTHLEQLTSRQREKVEEVAARAVLWPVNVTQRDTDFAWAKEYVRRLKVGSKSLLPGKPRSRIQRHETRGRKKKGLQHFGPLAEKLWLQLRKNRDELPDLIKRAGSKKARELKSKWISLCLSLPAVKTAQEITAQDARTWWKLGEALLQEAWEQDRQSAFGSVLAEYRGDYTDAFKKRDIFKRFKSAFLQLLKSGMNQTQ